MSLLVTGTVAFDSVKTPFGSRERVLGGSAAYFSLAASFFTSVQVVAVVGEDFPEAHLDTLRQRGIDTRGISRVKGKTFAWRGEYGHDLNEAHTLETQLNVLETFSPELPAEYRDARFVFLANLDPALQRAVKSQVRAPLLVAADTMNFWIEGRRDQLLETLGEVDLLALNDGEARMLAGEPSLVRAARRIRELGPRTVIIKRGEYGVALFGEGDTFAAPAFPLEDVLDPTGAGDSFAGGMMGYLARAGQVNPGTLRQAIICGSVMASFNVEDFSMDRFLRLSRDEVTERFRQFQRLTRFEDIEAPS